MEYREAQKQTFYNYLPHVLDPCLQVWTGSIEEWKANYKTKLVFVCGGVISGIGKGILTSSLALAYKQAGFDVSVVKVDPYLNVDANLLNPYEHGECFVLNDG